MIAAAVAAAGRARRREAFAMGYRCSIRRSRSAPAKFVKASYARCWAPSTAIMSIG